MIETEAQIIQWFTQTCIYMYVCREDGGSTTSYSRIEDTVPDNRWISTRDGRHGLAAGPGNIGAIWTGLSDSLSQLDVRTRVSGYAGHAICPGLSAAASIQLHHFTRVEKIMSNALRQVCRKVQQSLALSVAMAPVHIAARSDGFQYNTA